ncbi:hypothetical protein KC329_g106 [Hortaea werneckii]|nr:hypothetical protein KC329_g106 [Hortaea werneckii]
MAGELWIQVMQNRDLEVLVLRLIQVLQWLRPQLAHEGLRRDCETGGIGRVEVVCDTSPQVVRLVNERIERIMVG